jgi:hypothetical protein
MDMPTLLSAIARRDHWHFRQRRKVQAKQGSSSRREEKEATQYVHIPQSQRCRAVCVV